MKTGFCSSERWLALPLRLALGVLVWNACPDAEQKAVAATNLVPLEIKLPPPAAAQTPKDVPVDPLIEPLSKLPRPPMMVPPGLKNLAPGAKLTCSDKNATADMLAKLVDGDKESSEDSTVFLRKGTQWVQMDLGHPCEVFALVIWHAHNAPKVYHDVIVQASDDPDFISNVRMIFNNDQANSSGLGVGKDREYFETHEGKLIDAKGIKARYLRFYSKGSTEGAMNEYTEVEVYGPPGPMNRWLTLSLLLATGVAMGLRCPRLGQSPMHNDEAVNALKFRALWEHGEYKYDPHDYHGPTLPYATLAVERLTGAPDFAHFTEARFRFVTVLFGVGLILLLPLVADGLGSRAAAWAGLFTAVSPAMVFYSRDYIHEMLLVFFAFLSLAAGWRYWRDRKIGWALLAGAALGLMSATKETIVLSLGSAGLALFLNQTWNHALDASKLPVRAPRLCRGHLAAALAIWLAVAALLLSSFFTNADGPLDALRTYGPSLARAGGDSPHNHPWHFYLHRLVFFRIHNGPVWSEAMIVALGLIGVGAGFVRKGLGDGNASFVRFIALYTILLTVAYSLIAYKTPWCLLNFWHGMILLAGIGAAVLVRSVRRPWARIALTLLVLAGAGQLGAQAWQASQEYSADPRNPYVYAGTAPDLLDLASQVEALAEVSPEGHRTMVKVMAPERDYWPLPWYLRRFERVGWWEEVPADPWAPVMIVSTKFAGALEERKTHQMVRIFALRPGVFVELFVESGLWRDYVARRPARVEGSD